MLLRVHGIGVLLTGAPGAGKSALALELLARGHALVADDVVEVRRSPAGLIGEAAPALRGRLAVRELGIVDVRSAYGARALRERQRLELVVHLTRRRPLSARSQLHGRRTRRIVAGVSLPVLSLSANVAHNPPTLVEAACLQQRTQQ